MTEVRMPQMGLTMTEGIISKWYKKEGEAVQAGETLAEIETDKIASGLEAETNGILLKICADEGETIPVQGLLAVIGTEEEEVPPGREEEKESLPVTEEESPQAAGTPPAADKRLRISPLARRTAEALGVDCGLVQGSGFAGRIVQKDVLHLKEQQEERRREEKRQDGKKEEKRQTAVRQAEALQERMPLSRMRRGIGRRMCQSHREIPSVTLHVKADVTNLCRLRGEINEQRTSRISWNDCILKITARILGENWRILSSLQGEEIVYDKEVRMGMAVASPEGVVVPVIRKADTLSLTALSRKAKELAQKGREGLLLPDEQTGANFTVSNLGMYGVEAFTPMINPPESAILGVGAVEEELRMQAGAVEARQVMRLSLTFDHRVYDGDTAAQFAGMLKQGLEHPMEWIL